MKKSPNIGRSELEILRFITDHHPVTVREVALHFAQTHGHVRTTILNVMERLRHKGFLTRRKASGLFQYEPRQAKKELLGDLVRNFVNQTLGGSVTPFVAYLSHEADLSEDELTELKRLVADLDAKRTEGKA